MQRRAATPSTGACQTATPSASSECCTHVCAPVCVCVCLRASLPLQRCKKKRGRIAGGLVYTGRDASLTDYPPHSLPPPLSIARAIAQHVHTHAHLPTSASLRPSARPPTTSRGLLRMSPPFCLYVSVSVSPCLCVCGCVGGCRMSGGGRSPHVLLFQLLLGCLPPLTTTCRVWRGRGWQKGNKAASRTSSSTRAHVIGSPSLSSLSLFSTPAKHAETPDTDARACECVSRVSTVPTFPSCSLLRYSPSLLSALFCPYPTPPSSFPPIVCALPLNCFSGHVCGRCRGSMVSSCPLIRFLGSRCRGRRARSLSVCVIVLCSVANAVRES